MSDIGALRISINLDSADFTRGMQDINTRLRAVNSEFKASQAGAGRFDNSLTGLRSRADILNRTLEAHRAKVQELRRRYEESAKATGENSEQTMRLAAQYNNAVAAMRNTEDQLNLVNRRIEEQTNQWLVMQRQLHSAGESLRNIGDGMKNIGKDLTMKVTTPILGLGGAALKVGMDFESSMSKVQALTQGTGKEMEAMSAQAKHLGETTIFSASQAADGMAFLGMAGWKTSEILAGMPGLLNLAAAGAMDLGRAADITSNIMSGFAINAEEAGRVSDILAHAAANSNTNLEQLGEAMKYVAPMANALGISIEDSTAAMMGVADAGLQGSMGGRAFATSLTRLAAPTAQMKDEMKRLGLSFFDAEGSMKSMPEIIEGLEKAMSGMTDQQQATTLSILFGAEAQKHWAVLMSQGSKTLRENTKALQESEGAAERMAKTMTDNTKGAIVEFKSALEGIGIALAQHMIPAVTDIVKKATELVRKFGELDDGTQKNIIKIGLLTAAIGPLLVVGGTLISSLGAIMTGLGTLSGAIAVVTTGATAATPAIGGLAAVFTTLTGPIGITVAALAGIGVGIGLLVKDLKKPSIEIQRFGDDVSEATQKAVGGFLDLNDKATLALRELDLTSKEVTKETADAVTSNISQMADQMRDALEKRSTESLTIMQDFMKESVWISQQEKDEIIKNMNDKYTQQQEAITNGENIIKEIMQKAYDEKRELTTSEEIQINNIRENMVNNGIKILSQNEVEAKSIMERMKANASALTAEQAAEVVKKSIEQKEGAIQAAEEQYDQVVQNIIMQRDELGTITADQAHRMIFEAERQRDETVKHAEDMHQMVVDEAKAQAEEHVNHVNWETGEILTKWEKFKQDTSMKWQEMKADAANWWKQTSAEVKSRAEEIKTNAYNRFEELKKQTASKWEEVKSNTAEKWEEIKAWPGKKIEEMKVAVNKKMEEVRGDIERIWGKAEDFFAKVNLYDIGKDIIQGLINGIGDMGRAVWDKATEIANSIGNAIKSALDMHSPSRVTMKLGKWTGEGLEIGLESMVSKVQAAAEKLAIASTPKYRNSEGYTQHIDNSRIYQPKTTIIVQSNNSSPSEIARKNLQIQRQLGLEWGY